MHVLLFVMLTFGVQRSFQETHHCSGTDNGKPFCTYQVGDDGTNIVIGAPHGGYLKPASFPNRTYGCEDGKGGCIWSHTCSGPRTKKCRTTQGQDLKTREISVALADNIKSITGKRPHLIIMELHRIKLDANRDIDQSTFGVSAGKRAYREFHNFISKARNAIPSNGIYFDIHGQSHKERWHELGYLISKSELNGNIDGLGRNSSIRALWERSGKCLEEIIRGRSSLGYYLQCGGYKTIPSPAWPKPGTGKYYRGGYNTRRWGSMNDGGKIDAIQVEVHRSVRNDIDYPKFAKSLAKAIVRFMQENNY